MHPLAIIIDAEFHPHHHSSSSNNFRRRTTIDNSCLSANESLRILLQNEDNCDANNVDMTMHKNHLRKRRYSLNQNIRIAITFLAGINPAYHKRYDLDDDCHDHQEGEDSSKSNTNIRASRIAELALADLGNEGDSSDDDCDSFCDASVQDQANQEYLQAELGRSCFWDKEEMFSLRNNHRSSNSSFLFNNVNFNNSFDESDEDGIVGTSSSSTKRNSLVIDEDDEDTTPKASSSSTSSSPMARGPGSLQRYSSPRRGGKRSLQVC